MSAPCNHLTPPDAAGRKHECGLPATWQRNLLFFCDEHAREASALVPFRQINGPGQLDRRPHRRIIRRYSYPQRHD